MKRISFRLLILLASVLLIFSCEPLEDDPTPTHELMQGVWELTDAKDANNVDVLEKVSPLPVPNLISLNSTNGVISSAGPLFMYLVYGDNNFTNITMPLDQIFTYTDSDFGLTLGQWSLLKGQVTNQFAIEMTMKFPSAQTVSQILDMMGLQTPSIIKSVVYHKFKNVLVEIDEENSDVMYWTFDNQTIPEYNVKDDNLNYVLWNGISVNAFSRCKLRFEKRVKPIDQMVTEAYSK